MPYKNEIDIRDLQRVDLTRGELGAILTLLEFATAHLIVPGGEAAAAMDRLRKAVS